MHRVIFEKLTYMRDSECIFDVSWGLQELHVSIAIMVLIKHCTSADVC